MRRANRVAGQPVSARATLALADGTARAASVVRGRDVEGA